MLDLAHQLKLDLESAAEKAKNSITEIVELFHDRAIEAVIRFNTETELRLQLLAQGAPLAPAAIEPPLVIESPPAIDLSGGRLAALSEMMAAIKAKALPEGET